MVSGYLHVPLPSWNDFLHSKVFSRPFPLINGPNSTFCQECCCIRKHTSLLYCPYTITLTCVQAHPHSFSSTLAPPPSPCVALMSPSGLGFALILVPLTSRLSTILFLTFPTKHRNIFIFSRYGDAYLQSSTGLDVDVGRIGSPRTASAT